MLNLSTYYSIPNLCILCGKWFWINVQLMNHVKFEHLLINTPLVHFVWKMILNQRSPLHLPHWHLRENSVHASYVVKIFQSTHGWRCTLFLNFKPIHKTSPSSSFTNGVGSVSVPSSTPRGSGLATDVKNINKTILVSYFSQEEEHIVLFVENFFQHMAVKWAQTNHLWDPGSGGRMYALARSDGKKAKTS